MPAWNPFFPVYLEWGSVPGCCSPSWVCRWSRRPTLRAPARAGADGGMTALGSFVVSSSLPALRDFVLFPNPNDSEQSALSGMMGLAIRFLTRLPVDQQKLRKCHHGRCRRGSHRWCRRGSHRRCRRGSVSFRSFSHVAAPPAIISCPYTRYQQ